MPNHVKNLLKIEGEGQIVRFVYGCIKGDGDQIIDFNKIIPPPPFVFNDSAGGKEEELALKLDVPIWTQHNRNKWGTKWNAYSLERINENEITFETAWSCPMPVINAIADKFPMLKITLTYADEDTGANAGIITWYKGEKKENIPQNQSKQAYDIAFQLRPYYKEDYILEGDSYIYNEESE